MDNDNHLVWTPTYRYVAEKIREKKKLLFLIAPFIKREPLKRLLDECKDLSELQVIARWDPEYIVKGVTDLEIYEDLKQLGIPLYHHPHIHLKMLVFNQSWAYHSSGNITMNGLGLSSQPNIEVGAQIRLEEKDTIELQKLLADAIAIDEELYEKALEYKRDNPSPLTSLPPFEIKPLADKAFSRLSLPAVQSPEKLYEIYLKPEAYRDDEDLYDAYVHDIVLYDLAPELNREEFFHSLTVNFKAQPFVEAVAAFIQSQESVHFGGMNGWITEHCSDNPTPRRWEIKPTTNRLYDWLAYFFNEITWDRPRHSQVIYWRTRP
jgi:hypothetical protein